MGFSKPVLCIGDMRGLSRQVGWMEKMGPFIPVSYLN